MDRENPTTVPATVGNNKLQLAASKQLMGFLKDMSVRTATEGSYVLRRGGEAYWLQPIGTLPTEYLENWLAGEYGAILPSLKRAISLYLEGPYFRYIDWAEYHATPSDERRRELEKHQERVKRELSNQ